MLPIPRPMTSLGCVSYCCLPLEDWKREFKRKLDGEPNKQALKDSLQSLVDARNDFAHGGNPSSGISDVVTYYENSRRIIELMDKVIV